MWSINFLYAILWVIAVDTTITRLLGWRITQVRYWVLWVSAFIVRECMEFAVRYFFNS